ncbi:hypothetical protein [Trinickia fusca]|uniref:DUF2946 domain-containing protein n=1 Tax=Trinickia fusca TaxID=2419777 RepID=A0A494WYF3_9BURK|nr:hypothetical protein [Trinickia fusca]RKP43568.1 hypothetical protein D7S89_25325 [Trinickia fusca]
MSFWCRLLFVVLLTLGFAAQSFAVAPTDCESLHHAATQVATHGPMADERVAADHHRHATSHAHACSSCASCCVGGPLPSTPVVDAPAPGARVAKPLIRSAASASFLTGGIERPPRPALV